MAKKIKEVHPAVREALGYGLDESVADILKDWRERTSRVCKPCWELKYCPYGPLVEQLPLLPGDRSGAEEHNNYLRQCLETNMLGSVTPLDEFERERLEAILSNDSFARRAAMSEVRDEMRWESAANEEDPLRAMFGGPLPPLEIYRVPYEVREHDGDSGREDLSDDIMQRIESKMNDLKVRASEMLRTGVSDNRKPLDRARRALFEKQLSDYTPDDHPHEVPEIFREASCNIFGHICPVFFAAESITETSEERRRGRYIPFKTKMRVVRRDNHTCQECGIHLRDDEVEFDHKIPLSKGGSTEEHNIRLTCYDCNREKSGRVDI
jgi:hypothetical protein